MKQEPIIINVSNIINSPFCIDAEDGQKIYALVHRAMSEKKHVVLSFKDIKLLITAFLNTAIGQLFSDFSSEEIDTYLSKTDFHPDFESTWEKVVTGAPIYYAHTDKVKKEIREIMED